MQKLKIIFSIIAFCALFSISAKNTWGAWGEGSDEIDIIRLEDYDRFYDVTIGIDTVVQITDREFYRRLADKHIPFDSKQFYTLNERYRVFYLWKEHFAVRFVVTEDSLISPQEAAARHTVKLFDAKPFKMKYDCRCLETEELMLNYDINNSSHYFSPGYLSTKLGIAEGNNLRLYHYHQMQILQVDTAQYSVNCPPVYRLVNPYTLPYSYANIKEEYTANDVLHNYIYTKIFVNNKLLVKESDDRAWQNTDGVTMCYLLPQEIPPFEGRLTYQHCLKSGSSVTVSQPKEVQGKQMYRVNNTFPYIDRINVEVSYNMLYIPQVLYLAEPKFNYKININNDGTK